MTHFPPMFKATLAIVIVLGIFFVKTNASEKRSFTIDYEKNEFLKDGKVFRYVSGSLHYFQVPTQLWRDRMQKMKFGGLNALQTYIEWGTIEKSPGVYDFSGNNNITRFINMAQEEGLVVIIRVGPFIDAERDMGGLPSWLLKANPIQLRTSDPNYLSAVDRWLKVLLPMLRPLLYHNGGPVIMVQPENEYGSYTPFCATNGDYKAYMRETFRKILGNDIVLFTTDGNGDHYLKCGKIPDVFSTVDFGAHADVDASFAALRRNQANGPLVNSEFYSGWLDHWEEVHQTRQTELVCKTLDKMLSLNASVNIYMYHGGTNFGFTAGSNFYDNFVPVPTSYDYDAPISEAGDLTPKFYAIKEVIKKYLPVNDTKTFASSSAKMQLPPTQMERKASIFDVLPMPILAQVPRTFEQLNHSYGFMLYSSNLTFQPTDPAILSIPDLHDRAQVFIDKEFVGTLSATRQTLNVSVLASKLSTIDILVENQGRICFGDKINQSKGILSNVMIDHYPLTAWNHYRLFDDWTELISRLAARAKSAVYLSSRMPSFFAGTFTLPNKSNYPLDSFLQVTGWTKGVAFLNGYNLGRYWPVAGPQETLYAPSVYFRPYPQTNDIVLFELERSPCSVGGTSQSDDKCSIQFVSKHIINGTVPFQNHKH